MRNTSVRVVATWIFVLCQGTAVSQTVWTDPEILEWVRLPEAHVSTIDTTTPELRAQVEAGQRLGFRFERDLNGDGVIDLVAMGTWVQTGDWPHTFLVLVDGAGRNKMQFTYFTPSIVGIEYPDGLGISTRQDMDCVGRIGWSGEHFTVTGLTDQCIAVGLDERFRVPR
jgi:hypothetical protein